MSALRRKDDGSRTTVVPLDALCKEAKKRTEIWRSSPRIIAWRIVWRILRLSRNVHNCAMF